MSKNYFNKKTGKIYKAKQYTTPSNIKINENKLFIEKGEWVIEDKDGNVQILSDDAFRLNFSPTNKNLLLD